MYIYVLIDNDRKEGINVSLYQTRAQAQHAMVEKILEKDEGYELLGKTREEKLCCIDKRDDPDRYEYEDGSPMWIERHGF